MRFFDFVEEHDRIGMPPHRLGELSAFFVADVSRRRADETRDGMLLHVFGHVDADHGALVVEKKFGKCARQFGFADAGWPQEYKGADRPLRIAQSGARTANGVGYAFERLVLSDDAQPQAVFHVDELLDFAFEHLGNRNAGPLGDDAGNVFLIDFFFQHAMTGLAVDLRGDFFQLFFCAADEAVADLRHALQISFAFLRGFFDS